MSEHWYTQAGTPAYEVPAANGAMRSTTLRDARKLGLVPSVTTILSVKAKPALETWKVRQGILAALTLPRIDGEPENEWLARIEADSRRQAADAAEEGTRIHDAIERSYKGWVVPEHYQEHVAGARAEVARLFPGVEDWIAEDSFAHSLGFGGKIDLRSPSTGFIVDFKGKDGDFSDGKKLAYDQNEQLAAYRLGSGYPPVEAANVFVSRTHPGKASGHKWSVEDMAAGERVFLATLALWKCMRGFDPSFGHRSIAA